MDLGFIICGKDKPCKYIRRIKSYNILTGDSKKHFMSKNPVIYEEMDGACYSADLSEIVLADFSKSIASIGDRYKIPNEYIREV